MATDARKHTAFAVSEKPTMAAFNNLSLSINDVMPVSNGTTQASQAAAIAAAGVSLATNPLVTIRQNAPGLHRIEYSYDGSVFVPASGVMHFSSTTSMNSWTTANSAYLTAGDTCQVGASQYVWSGTAWVLSDTGAITSGFPSLQAATHWAVSSYSMRMFHGFVTGSVTCAYTGSTLTPDSAGNLGDQPSVLTLPNGWAPSYTKFSTATVSGLATYATRIYNSGEVDLTHAFNARPMVSGDNVQFDFNHSSI